MQIVLVPKYSAIVCLLNLLDPFPSPSSRTGSLFLMLLTQMVIQCILEIMTFLVSNNSIFCTFNILPLNWACRYWKEVFGEGNFLFVIHGMFLERHQNIIKQYIESLILSKPQILPTVFTVSPFILYIFPKRSINCYVCILYCLLNFPPYTIHQR